MSVYLIDSTTFLTLWAFDVELTEKSDTTIEWTEYPVEADADMTDFGKEKPQTFSAGGFQTATPFDQPYSPQRVMDADAALRALALKKQPVTYVGTWIEEVVIGKVSGTVAAGEGDGIGLTVELKTIRRPTPEKTKIPPAQMKAKVRKRSSSSKAGGTSSGTTPKPGSKKARSLAAIGDDWSGKKVSGALGSLFN